MILTRSTKKSQLEKPRPFKKNSEMLVEIIKLPTIKQISPPTLVNNTLTPIECTKMKQRPNEDDTKR